MTGADINDGSLAGADVANNSLAGADVGDNTLTGLDVAPSSLNGSDIANGTLNDEDVGEATLVDFTVNVGEVPAQDCIEKGIIGVSAPGDHILLTRNSQTSQPNLIYSIEYHDSGSPLLQICNPTAFPSGDDTTQFNLLVFDAH